MPPRRRFVPLHSTARPKLAGKKLGQPAADKRIEVTLLLRRPPDTASTPEKVLALGARKLARRTPHLTHAEFADKFGADADDIAKVEAFAHEYGFSVVNVQPAARMVTLSGTIAVVTKAFAVRDLVEMEGPGGRFRHHSEPVSVPAELEGVVISVFGIDSAPAARPHGKSASGNAAFTAPQVAQLYNFPADLDGSGQCIGIIALNEVGPNDTMTGGFAASDLESYFKLLKLPQPKVVSVSVAGGANNQKSLSNEITLDVEIAGSAAPGAKLVVYFAPNTAQGFVQAMKTAVHDATNRPSVISVSWGSPEDPSLTPPAQVLGLDDALQDAVHLGITVCVATGDLGSIDLLPPGDGEPHVDAPASSPFALACGGTCLVARDSKIASEMVWNGVPGLTGATGGGVSNVFDRPDYQSQTNNIPVSPKRKKGRGTPDLSGHVGPYQMRLGGKTTSSWGTSAVAPLFAGLMARINQQLEKAGKPRAGFINPLLYQAQEVFRDIVAGYNGSPGNNDLTGTMKVYKAQPGWDACTGLGVPDGTKLMQQLAGGVAPVKSLQKRRKLAPK